MKRTKQGPSSDTTMANINENNSQNTKYFTAVRNDINRLIDLQEQLVNQVKELVSLNMKILQQLNKSNGERK